MAFVRDFKGFGSIGAGTKTDPIKINKPTSRVYNGYIPENTPDGSRGPVTIPRGSKIYFEIDPAAIAGGPISSFRVDIKFFSGFGTVCKLTQDKTTGAYSPEVCKGYSSMLEIVYDNRPFNINNSRFLYALVGSPDGDINEEIWVTIAPSTGAVVQPAAVTVVAPVVTTEVVQPIIVQRVPYNGGTVGVDSSGNYVPNSYIANVQSAESRVYMPTPVSVVEQPAAEIQPAAVESGISSIMAGMPSWGWIALVGVGAFMLFGRGKGSKSKE